MAGYILTKGWLLMTGTTTGLAPARFVVGAAKTKHHVGALVEGEEGVMMDPFCMVLWQRRAIITSQSLRIYSFTLDMTLSVSKTVHSLIAETVGALGFPSPCTNSFEWQQWMVSWIPAHVVFLSRHFS